MLRSTRDAFCRGRDLFDRGAFFEAHEAWEAAWLLEAGSVRTALQGLIQIAAALHKASRAEHARGCVQLFDAGLDKLESARDAVPSWPLARFRKATRATREQARAWAAGESGPLAPEDFPRLGGRAGAARRLPARRGSTRKRSRGES